MPPHQGEELPSRHTEAGGGLVGQGGLGHAVDEVPAVGIGRLDQILVECERNASHHQSAKKSCRAQGLRNQNKTSTVGVRLQAEHS